MHNIFRAYDIRGIYPDEINEELAYKIGVAFGRLIGKGRVAVGRDARLSGKVLRDSFVRGLMGEGIEVIDIGVVATPMLYFSVAHDNLDAGVMITASHNPKEYNGFKFVGKNATAFSYETGIGKIKEMVTGGIESRKLKGNVKEMNIEHDYIEFVMKNVNIEKRLKIVIDAGNGTAGLTAKKLFEKLGMDVTCIYCEPDGNFPNHIADPLKKETLKDLQRLVVENNADIGIAYDGDGDRVGFVDDKGNAFDNNLAFALMIKDVLSKKKGCVVYEVSCSDVVRDVIERNGGVPALSRVGHSYIQKRMISDRCVFGGETSGHYYFAESFGYDDGMFASAKMVEMLSKSEKKLSELIAGLPKYYTSHDNRIHCPDEIKFRVVEAIKDELKQKYNVIDIDGAKVIMPEGWFLIRASNTQPAIVLRWEARSKEDMENIGRMAKDIVEKKIKEFS